MTTDPESADDASPQARPMPDMALYERLIDDGLAKADAQGGPVDHLTARRLAIWLAARPQHPDFTRSLNEFIRTGAVSRDLRAQLRMRARSADYLHRSQAVRLMQYSASRQHDWGPVGPDFGGAGDQLDQVDAILADRREQVRQGNGQPQQARPDLSTPIIAAQATRHPSGNRTVTLVMDEATANLAIFAITVQAGEREAHLREVEQFAHGLPEGSYGRQNREAIAARERRAALHLRAIERAYRTAIEHDAVVADAPAAATRPADRAADREIEME
jgi:hypothetical protein